MPDTAAGAAGHLFPAEGAKVPCNSDSGKNVAKNSLINSLFKTAAPGLLPQINRPKFSSGTSRSCVENCQISPP